MATLRYEIPIAPVSQQAASDSKAALKSQVQTIISKDDFFLTGEVRVNIDWMVHDRIRYETDQAPDIDNIIKPTLDAITGPSGILIDDCQVQRVNCGWIDSPDETQRFSIEIDYFEDEQIPSREVLFVQFENGLCFPFDKSLPDSLTKTLIEHLVERLAARDKILQLTGSHRTALHIMPIQRFFHRTRIHGFPVVTYRSFLEQTDQGLANNAVNPSG